MSNVHKEGRPGKPRAGAIKGCNPASVWLGPERYRCANCGHRAKHQPFKVASKSPPNCRKCGGHKWWKVKFKVCTLDCYAADGNPGFPHQAGYGRCRSTKDGSVVIEELPGKEGDYPF